MHADNSNAFCVEFALSGKLTPKVSVVVNASLKSPLHFFVITPCLSPDSWS